MLAQPTYSVPGVYSQPHVRAEAFPRLRTDVAGFVGAGGPNYLGQAVRVDDWRSYLELFRKDDSGNWTEAPPGSRLDTCVREFFTNGGARCWIVNVASTIEPGGKQALLNTMLGVNDDTRRTGLELLLRQEEVSIVVLPELDAVCVEKVVPDPVVIPGSPCFRTCRGDQGREPLAQRAQTVSGSPLFSDAEIMWAQRYLISRLQKERWRWFAILATPRNKNHAQAIKWRRDLVKNLGKCDFAALYWPWLRTQQVPGEAVTVSSPVGCVTGIFARRDRQRGPHVAPANEQLHGVVGLERVIDNDINAEVYDAGVNVIRSLPGLGIRLWGARTLLWGDPDSRFEALSFVNARRCLSAIARTAYHLGQQSVFETNNALLQAQIAMVLFGYLNQVYEGGALKGATPDQAFYVRCDRTNNPPEQVAKGELVCNVGVALAAPAEFIVFRVGRKNSVTEIEEAA
jgi:hypothetical protein